MRSSFGFLRFTALTAYEGGVGVEVKGRCGGRRGGTNHIPEFLLIPSDGYLAMLTLAEGLSQLVLIYVLYTAVIATDESLCHDDFILKILVGWGWLKLTLSGRWLWVWVVWL